MRSAFATSKRSIQTWHGKTIGELTAVELQEWLRNESPVDLDLFGLAETAHRILQRLANGKNTVAVLGSFGAGKTSLVEMAEKRAFRERKPLWFVRISCWGFEDSSRVQQEVLSQVVKYVGNRVDCLGIRGLPNDYMDAVTKQVSWFGLLQSFASHKLSPLEQLQRLSPILRAIGLSVVVVIEDVDRNGRSFDLSHIQALLARFREVNGLSFVLAISAGQQFDFAKLCEFVEPVPTLTASEILKTVHKVRQLCLEHFAEDILPDELEPLTDADDRYDVHQIFYGDFQLWQNALTELLKTPRALKFTLRRVVEVWDGLHGEISIDLLIMSSVLREAASPAFSFLVENYRRIKSAASARSQSQFMRGVNCEKPTDDLRSEWKALVEKTDFNVRAAAVLMVNILPESKSIVDVETFSKQKKQGLSDTRWEAYARRLFGEGLKKDEAKDQHVLRLMQDVENQESGRALAENIAESEQASSAFEHFGDLIEAQQLLSLLALVYEVLRKKRGRHFGRDDAPGFFSCWRLLKRKELPTEFEDWLADELKKCIPGHLRMLTDIYYFWLGTDKHNFQERIKAREAVITTAHKRFTAENLAKAFDPSFPYTLFHLIFTSDYKQPEEVPFSKASDWKWVAALLLQAAYLNPGEILPQIIILVNLDEGRDRERLRYTFDEKRLEEFFGNESKELLKLIAGGFPIYQEMDQQVQHLLNLAIKAARKLLGLDEE